MQMIASQPPRSVVHLRNKYRTFYTNPESKIAFCNQKSMLSEIVQMGPWWSPTVRFRAVCNHFRTLMQPSMFGHFWAKEDDTLIGAKRPQSIYQMCVRNFQVRKVHKIHKNVASSQSQQNNRIFLPDWLVFSANEPSSLTLVELNFTVIFIKSIKNGQPLHSEWTLQRLLKHYIMECLSNLC